MRASELLQSLVRIPSVNPMGRPVSGADDVHYEARLTQFLLGEFARIGAPAHSWEVLPGRANVVARYDAGSPVTVLWDAHQDTVPTDGMTVSPFGGELRGGRIYGRGACDVKGGMAAMLTAFERLVRTRPPGAANVVMSCTCDEEAGATGVAALARAWTDPGGRIPLIDRPPDVAVVAEPTALDVVVAHRGATRWKIVTHGRACHSSQPMDGVNAIYKMAAVLRELERYAAELPGKRPAHPLCGPATLSVGRITGGVSVNTVPDRCEIEIDRRCIPGEDGLAVIDELRDVLSTRTGVEFEFEPPWLVGATLSDENNGRWADLMLEAAAARVGRRRKVGVPYGTNASRISATGVPAIVWGPGSIEQAHTADEWIDVNELEAAADVYFQFAVAAGRMPGA